MKGKAYQWLRKEFSEEASKEIANHLYQRFKLLYSAKNQNANLTLAHPSSRRSR